MPPINIPLAKAENPFDELLRHAIAKHRTGKTRPLREFARAEGISLDEEITDATAQHAP